MEDTINIEDDGTMTYTYMAPKKLQFLSRKERELLEFCNTEKAKAAGLVAIFDKEALTYSVKRTTNVANAGKKVDLSGEPSNEE